MEPQLKVYTSPIPSGPVLLCQVWSTESLTAIFLHWGSAYSVWEQVPQGRGQTEVNIFEGSNANQFGPTLAQQKRSTCTLNTNKRGSHSQWFMSYGPNSIAVNKLSNENRFNTWHNRSRPHISQMKKYGTPYWSLEVFIYTSDIGLGLHSNVGINSIWKFGPILLKY